MGDFADDTFDRAIQEEIEEADNFKLFSNKSDDEIRKIITLLIARSDYKSDQYTDMVKSIVAQKTWSEKQRDVLFKHLYFRGYFLEDENYDEYLHDDWGNRDK